MEGALDDLTMAIQLDPNNVAAYDTRGIIYYQIDRYRSALSDFLKVLQIDPAMNDKIQPVIDDIKGRLRDK